MNSEREEYTAENNIKKYSILTFIFDDYENIREPLEVSPNCEYILVTDNHNLSSKVWTIKYLPDVYKTASGFTKSFYVRYHPFEFVSTNVCIVLDGSIQIKKSLDKIINDFLKSNADICLSVHWNIKNPFEEYVYWTKHRNYSETQYLKNKAMLKALGFSPTYKGCFETNFKICKNDATTKSLHEFTYSLLEKLGSPKNVDRLDQSIFSGVMATQFTNLNVFLVTHQIIQNEYMMFCHHKSNEPYLCNINFSNLWFRNKKTNVYIL